MTCVGYSTAKSSTRANEVCGINRGFNLTGGFGARSIYEMGVYRTLPNLEKRAEASFLFAETLAEDFAYSGNVGIAINLPNTDVPRHALNLAFGTGMQG